MAPAMRGAGTQAGGMSTLQYKAIDAGRLDAMRGQGADEFGNPWRQRTAEGWEPLRCCLRSGNRADQLQPVAAALGHAVGRGGTRVRLPPPVRGLPDPEYPPGLADRHTQLNPFDHEGSRAYEHITFVGRRGPRRRGAR